MFWWHLIDKKLGQFKAIQGHVGWKEREAKKKKKRKEKRREKKEEERKRKGLLL